MADNQNVQSEDTIDQISDQKEEEEVSTEIGSEENTGDAKKKKERSYDRQDLMKLSRILIWITTGFVTVSSFVFLSVLLGFLTPEVQATITYYVNVYLPVMFIYVACWLTSIGISLFYKRYPTWMSTRKMLSALTVINLIQVIFQMVAWYYLLSGI